MEFNKNDGFESSNEEIKGTAEKLKTEFCIKIAYKKVLRICKICRFCKEIVQTS